MDEMAAPAPYLSIVVPVYRSADILPRLVEAIDAALRGALAGRFEVLLVCDASPDKSWEVIEQLAARHAFVRGLWLRKNSGQHNATMAGLNHARGDRIVIIDDDLQHPPSAIPQMLAELDQGFDVCYTRYRHRRHALWKKAGSWGNDLLASLLLNKPRGLYLSSFKALRGEVAREVVKYDGPFAYVDGLILDVTSAVTSIDIEHQDRFSGRGNYNFRRSFSLLLKMATSFSVLPLRVVSILGMILAVVSLGVVLYAVIAKLRDPSIQAGWASTMAAVLFVGGVQLLGLGMIGEYLGRTYLKINRKPQFVVRKTTWKRED
jgi:glycosyltransferase involved in cell wall biosynthesis